MANVNRWIKKRVAGRRSKEEQAFIDAMIQADRETRGEGCAELIQHYQELEKSILPRGRYAKLEARRRIAEHILLHIRKPDCPLATVREQFRRLSGLGFRTLERKATYHTFYARYLIGKGQGRSAARLLKPVEVALRRQLSRSGHPLYKHLLDGVTSLLNQVPAKTRG